MQTSRGTRLNRLSSGDAPTHGLERQPLAALLTYSLLCSALGLPPHFEAQHSSRRCDGQAGSSLGRGLAEVGPPSWRLWRLSLRGKNFRNVLEEGKRFERMVRNPNLDLRPKLGSQTQIWVRVPSLARDPNLGRGPKLGSPIQIWVADPNLDPRPKNWVPNFGSRPKSGS